jgi:hypothetical protein
MRRAALLAVVVLAAGCGGSSTPKEDPSVFAKRVLDQIVHNRYSQVWEDLHSKDQQVAPFGEYVQCEDRSPVITVPRTVKVTSVSDESVGIGDGTFVQSKAVDLRLGFAGGFHLTHTVHVVAEKGKWRFILPPWRFRDYKADRCPTDPGSSAAPAQS